MTYDHTPLVPSVWSFLGVLVSDIGYSGQPYHQQQADSCSRTSELAMAIMKFSLPRFDIDNGFISRLCMVTVDLRSRLCMCHVPQE